MNANSGKDKIARFFDGYVNGFDALYGGENGLLKTAADRLFRRSIRLRFEQTLKACEPAKGKTILDVGCGPGHYCLALAERGAIRVLGIDFAPQMISLARSRAEERSLDGVCSFEVMDFFALEGERFDQVIMMGFMDYMEDAEAALQKALSLCRGSLLVSFPCAEGLLAWQRQLRYKRKCPLFLYRYDEVEKLLRGLDAVRFRIRKLSRDYWTEIWVER